MKRIYLLILFVCAIAISGCQEKPTDTIKQEVAVASSVTQQAIVPQPIPAGFDFPADRAALQAFADANDVVAMRKHSWNLWAGLTVDSKSVYSGQTLPIWETWLSTAQVFKNPPIENSANAMDANRKIPAREFKDPDQFFHVKVTDIVEEVSEADSGIVGFNKYDPTMVQYLWVGHPAPKAPDNDYFYTSSISLKALNDTWGDTPIIDRKVVDAPNTALELKPVLMWVKAEGLTAIPFWQGPNNSTDKNCTDVSVEALRHPKPGQPATKCHPDPSTWTHCVLIDPNNSTAGLQPATEAQFAGADFTEAKGCTDAANAQYGGINMLYNFKLSADEAAAFNKAQHPGEPAKSGDFMVFLAMHVNTKEIIDWTWQTYWWQGGQETPDEYPGSGADRTANIIAPWTNYNMCTAYAQTTQPDNKGDMNVCFNPYLETSSGIPDGLRSNCVTCHGTATVGTPKTGGYPATYDQPVDFGDPIYFGGATKTDFSWAVPSNAQPQKN
jgi:hypothetical protein